MIIILSPVRMDATLTVSRAGDVLTINGDDVDLTTYTGGCDWIVGMPVLDAGVWHVTLVMPHGGDAPETTRFPVPITTGGDGPVDLPVYDGVLASLPDLNP